MCDICGLFFCEPQCPSYDGRDPLYGIPVGECAVCERMILADEEFFADRSLLLCAACLDKRDGLAGLKKIPTYNHTKGPRHTPCAKGER